MASVPFGSDHDLTLFDFKRTDAVGVASPGADAEYALRHASAGYARATRTGPVDCILAAPRPRIPAMRGHAHGLYAADIAVATGYVYATRVIESSGNPDLDNAMLNALQQWRFRPRLIYKLVVPVEFHGHNAHLGR